MWAQAKALRGKYDDLVSFTINLTAEKVGRKFSLLFFVLFNGETRDDWNPEISVFFVCIVLASNG